MNTSSNFFKIHSNSPKYLYITYFLLVIISVVTFLLYDNPVGKWNQNFPPPSLAEIHLIRVLTSFLLLSINGFLAIFSPSKYKLYISKALKETVFFFLPIFVSSLINQSIYDNFTSFAYDILVIFNILVIVHHNVDVLISSNLSEKNKVTLIFFSNLLMILFILTSIFLSLLNSYKYGDISNLSIARDHRYYLELYSFAGGYQLNPAIFAASVLVLQRIKLGTYSFFQITSILFISNISGFVFALFSGSRTFIVAYLLSIIFIFLYNIKNSKDNTSKILWILIPVIFISFIVYLNWDFIVSIYILNEASSQHSDLLTGRGELWDFYFRSFLDHPFFGNGTNFLFSSGYMGDAISEAGFIRVIAENGVFGSLGFIWISLLFLRSLFSYFFKLEIYSLNNRVIWKYFLLICLFVVALIFFIDYLTQRPIRALDANDLWGFYSIGFIIIFHKKQKFG